MSAIHAEREFVNDKRYGAVYMSFKGQLRLYSMYINQHTYTHVRIVLALFRFKVFIIAIVTNISRFMCLL